MPTGSINILFGKNVREAILINLIKKKHKTSTTKGQSTKYSRVVSRVQSLVVSRGPGTVPGWRHDSYLRHVVLGGP